MAELLNWQSLRIAKTVPSQIFRHKLRFNRRLRGSSTRGYAAGMVLANEKVKCAESRVEFAHPMRQGDKDSRLAFVPEGRLLLS